MLNAGQPGFVHAPITKCIISLVVLCTLFGSIISSQTRLTLRMNEVIEKLQIWRLITHNFMFTTPGELLFGIVLLYFFRQFERQLGSSRFAAYALITCTIYTCLLVAWELLVPTILPASGPYFLVFSSVIYFFFETPKIYHFQVVGAFELSDKSFAYLLAIQLIFSSPPRSLVSCAAGVIAGIIYRIPPVREYADIPDGVVRFCSQNILPFLGTTPRPGSSRSRARPMAAAAPANGRGRENEVNEEENEESGISEGNVETLLAMGFARDQAMAALQASHDDVERATEILLS